MRSDRLYYFLLVLVLCTACSDPGRTTTIAATTGGVIGAGLGAVVGNQTGNPGSGLAIGAAVGAGTGAAVGSALETQEKRIDQQSEEISKQEKQIASQRSEIQELRSRTGDSVRFDPENAAPATTSDSATKDQWWNGAKTNSAPKAMIQEKTIEESNLTSPQEELMQRGSFGSPASAPVSDLAQKPQGRKFIPEENTDKDSAKTVNKKEEAKALAMNPTPAKPAVNPTQEKVKQPDTDLPKQAVDETAKEEVAAVNSGSFSSSECQEASKEAGSAKTASDVADKLFHYRRALRLCPENPSFHNALGEVYLSLSRNDDAEFEFKEALRIDPSFSAAKSNLAKSR